MSTVGLKIAEGREAEVYEWGSAAVAKLYRPGYLGHVAEASALAALNGTGVAPALIGTVDIDARHGLILQRLDGAGMFTLLQRTPWRLTALARTLAEAHVLVNGVRAPDDLPDLRYSLARNIEAGVTSPPLRDFALRTLDRLPAGDRLCHGDLHPGNILVGSSGPSVIDWANATRGAPEADHARTLWLLRQGDPLPGTPALFRVLISVGRRMFARAYARRYRERSPYSLRQLRSWTIVHAAARLAEGITVEEPRLLAYLDREYRTAR